jgi:hypothetical protein
MLVRSVAYGLAAAAIALGGCTEVRVEDPTGGQGASSGGSMTGNGGGPTGGGSSGDPGTGTAACPTGASFATFGASAGATIGIVADASGVYWTNDEGSVWRAAPGGGDPHAIATGLGAELSAIARDDGALYVVDYGAALWQLGKDGSAPTVLAKGNIITVAADASGVYFVTNEGVLRAGNGGEAPVLLAPVEGAGSIALDEAWVYVKTLGNPDDPTARVVRVPKTGGAVALVADCGLEAYHYGLQELAVGGSDVYWVAPAPGTVMKAPKAGGAPVALATGIADPVSIAVDGATIYFTVRGKDGGSDEDRAVARVPAAGGAVSYVAHGPSTSAYGVALDATHAYWTEKVTTGPVSTACK